MKPPSVVTRRRSATAGVDGCALGVVVGRPAVGVGAGVLEHAARRPVKKVKATPRTAAGKEEPCTGAPAAGFGLPARRRPGQSGSQQLPDCRSSGDRPQGRVVRAPRPSETARSGTERHEAERSIPERELRRSRRRPSPAEGNDHRGGPTFSGHGLRASARRARQGPQEQPRGPGRNAAPDSPPGPSGACRPALRFGTSGCWTQERGCRWLRPGSRGI